MRLPYCLLVSIGREDELDAEMRRRRIRIGIGGERETVRLTVEGVDDFPLIAAERRAIFRKRRALGPALLVHEITAILSMKDSNVQLHDACC